MKLTDKEQKTLASLSKKWASGVKLTKAQMLKQMELKRKFQNNVN